MNEDDFVDLCSKVVMKLRKSGPNRVLLVDSLAYSSNRAREKGVNPSIIFVRSDGWTLASDDYMEINAYKEYESGWVGFLRKGDQFITPIERYNPPETIDE